VAIGTSPDAFALNPPGLPEPTFSKNDEGGLLETNARDIIICQNPIGEENFVRTFHIA
jgi:hypothetical protein